MIFVSTKVVEIKQLFSFILCSWQTLISWKTLSYVFFLIYSLWLVNIIDKVCKCIWFLSTFKEIVKTILWLQEWPIQPGLHPESHTPLTWLHPAHVPLQFSEQSWPNKPFVQAGEIKGHILNVFFKYVSEIYFFLISPHMYVMLCKNNTYTSLPDYNNTHVFYMYPLHSQQHTQIHMLQ